MVGFSFLLHTAENMQSVPFVMEIDLPIGARLLTHGITLYRFIP